MAAGIFGLASLLGNQTLSEFKHAIALYMAASRRESEETNDFEHFKRLYHRRALCRDILLIAFRTGKTKS